MAGAHIGKQDCRTSIRGDCVSKCVGERVVVFVCAYLGARGHAPLPPEPGGPGSTGGAQAAASPRPGGTRGPSGRDRRRPCGPPPAPPPEHKPPVAGFIQLQQGFSPLVAHPPPPGGGHKGSQGARNKWQEGCQVRKSALGHREGSYCAPQGG